MAKRLTTEEFIIRSIEIHENRFDYLNTVYINNHTKVCIGCKDHGSYWQLPAEHLRGHGCPQCSGQRIVLDQDKTSNWILHAIKYHGNSYDYSKVVYTTSYASVLIGCHIHGYFLQVASEHLRGRGCSKCFFDKRRDTSEIFIKKATDKYGNKYDYSLVSYVNSITNIIIICPVHGRFKQRPYTHLNGCGCKKCGYEKNAKAQNSSTLEFIEKAIQCHDDLYDYTDSIYVSSDKKLKIRCKSKHIFYQTPNCHLGGSGCPQCNRSHTISKKETKFLDHLNIPKRAYYLPEWKAKSVDGFDPETNTVYEFLGDFWHGNPIKFSGHHIHPFIKKTYGYLYDKTFEKLNKLKSLGYNVKYIWENDWNKFKGGIDIIPNIQTI